VTRNIRYVGLDVHAATVAVAVTEGRGEVRSLGQIPNSPEAVTKLVKKLRVRVGERGRARQEHGAQLPEGTRGDVMRGAQAVVPQLVKALRHHVQKKAPLQRL
jgi:hypothetical protein